MASGREYSALVTWPQAQGSSSPSHPSLPESWDIPWKTQPSGSRHKEGDFSLLLAWALGTEHLSMRASRKFGWQTSKEGKYICPNTKEEALDGSREGTARDARLAGDSSVPGPSGHPCSWQPGAPYSTTLFCLDGLEADASTSLPPRAAAPDSTSLSLCLPGAAPSCSHRGPAASEGPPSLTPIPGASLPPPPRSTPAPGTPFLSVLNGPSH